MGTSHYMMTGVPISAHSPGQSSGAALREPMEPIPIVVPADSPSTEIRAPRGIAPVWHTVLLVVALIAFSVAGADSQHGTIAAIGRPLFYLSTMLFEWGLLFYVWWGVAKRGMSMRELIGGRWERFEDILLDVALAIGFWFAALMVLAGVAFALRLKGPSSIGEAIKPLAPLVPHSSTELLIWAGLSITAGVCEEVIFRGYFQKQFGNWARTMWLGLIASAVLFGAGHGYEGRQKMLIIGVYGLLFGLLAHFRRSLRPGMITHAIHDFVMGTFLYFLVTRSPHAQ